MGERGRHGDGGEMARAVSGEVGGRWWTKKE